MLWRAARYRSGIFRKISLPVILSKYLPLLLFEWMQNVGQITHHDMLSNTPQRRWYAFFSHGNCAANDMWAATVLMWWLWMEETANEYYSQAASEGSFRIGAKLNDRRFATERLWVPVLFCSGLILHFKTYCDCINPPNNGRAQCTNSKLQQLLLDICNEHLPVCPTQTGSYVALYCMHVYTFTLGQFIGGCLLYRS